MPCSHLRLVSVTTNQIAKVRNSRYRASHVTLCVSLRAGRPRAGDSDTTRSASRFQNVERRSHRRARRRSPRAASNANFVDCKFDRAVEIDRVVFLLHRRGLVGEKRFESKRPIFGSVLHLILPTSHGLLARFLENAKRANSPLSAAPAGSAAGEIFFRERAREAQFAASDRHSGTHAWARRLGS